MYTVELGVFMYRYSINDLPISFKDYFKKRSDIHKYETRPHQRFAINKQ